MKLSVVTPSYNQRDWLSLAMASVGDQATAGFSVEHRIVDGGSTDGTVETLAGWKEKVSPAPSGTSFFSYLSEPDKGMYDAINKGFDLSDGDIFAYLNCDEQYLPGALGKVAGFFSKHPGVDILFGDAILLDAKGKALSYRRMVKPNRWHTRLCHLSTLSCAMFFRRRIWESGLRFPEQFRMIGDAVFVEGVLAGGFKAAVYNQALATFAFTGMNQSQSLRAKEETSLWRRGPGAPPSWWALPLVLQHRIKKMAAGAYATREQEYAIFTEESPDHRQVFKASSLGWKWPGEAEV